MEQQSFDLEGKDLVQAIKKDFGFEIADIKRVAKAYQSEVYKALTPQKETIFIKKDKVPKRLEIEIQGYRIFKDLGIPVPEVIAYQENPPTIKKPTIIISAARGVNLENTNPSEQEESKIYKSWGDVARRINGLKIKGFGPITLINNTLQGKYKTYQEFVASPENNYEDVIRRLVEHRLLTDEELQKLKEIIKEINNLKINQGFLLHRDMKPDHIFVEQDRITGIIDLARLEAGDPRNEIAKSLLLLSEKQQNYFKRGYGSDLVNDPMVTKYLVVRAATMALPRSKEGHMEIAKNALRILKKTIAKL